MIDTPDTPTQPVTSPAVSRWRATLLHLSLVVLAVAIIWRTAMLQLVEGEQWSRVAAAQHMRSDSLVAPRGAITDARGVPLAVSNEFVRLEVSPKRVRGVKLKRSVQDSLARRLSRELAQVGVPRAAIRRALDSTQSSFVLPGSFLPSEAQRLMRRPGITGQWSMERLASGTGAIRQLVGAVDADGQARSGLELALDSLLQGTRGLRLRAKDGRGGLYDSPVGLVESARVGDTVRLTINMSLQEIIERELLAAIARTGAEGGDIVVLDPDDGAILALAGARNRRIAPSVTPLTQPYQPGSVLKPFFVARLLDNGRVRSGDLINTENGSWDLDGRRITDEHKAPFMSVFDVVRWSSNIGTVKLVTTHLAPAEEYQLLRDYGFGVPTGLPYPSESRGTLRDPSSWTRVSAASHAIGYELAVTPVQLAVAYAAIANGGDLLEPALVRQIRSSDGVVTFRHARHVVRRVGSAESMEQVRLMLKAVVDSGTGRSAGLAAYEVGGKSGTARRAESRGSGTLEYDATFAGMFPMSNPQMVVVARLMSPKSAIFGGVVAGPMVREVLRGAIAARDAALDRGVLARVARASANERADSSRALSTTVASPAGAVDAVGDNASATDEDVEALVRAGFSEEAAPGRVIISVPYAPEAVTTQSSPMRRVPNVSGLPLRDAVRALHATGFRVKLASGGVAGRTRPAAGATARQHSAVTLEQGPNR